MNTTMRLQQRPLPKAVAAHWPQHVFTTALAVGLACSSAVVASGGETEPNLAVASAVDTGGGEAVTNSHAAALLKLMSVEDLMNVTVTSVSKKAERLSTTPAAVAVISQEDIRHSGATTIPEALRLAPGVFVGQVDSHQWAISVRGFNDTFAQKLLVMMDGRSIYTPLFSGTLWQAQDYMMEDLDRIEVVRGPGGSVWGANAVNGVISIVSKSAKDTQGLLVSGGGGSSQRALASARYGDQLGEHTFFRVYGKYAAYDDFPLVDGGENADAWWHARGGFRLDHEPSEDNLFTFQGDYYGLDSDTTVPVIQPVPPVNSEQQAQWEQQGGNLLARWTHTISEDSDLSLQAYYDYTRLTYPLLDQQLNTIDVDARHRFQLGGRQEIVWGGGYRLNSSRLDDSAVIVFSDPDRNDQLFNVFVQDQIALVPERLRLTLGIKLEHNDYTGFEYQPNGRLSWSVNEHNTLWASVSRAVRTPSQIEADGRINLSALPPIPPNPLPSLVALVGNEDYGSEDLIAYELGYRVQPHEKLSVDLAGFVNSYDNLRGASEQIDLSTAPLGYVQLLSNLENNIHGNIYGGELVVTWQTADWWRLYASYALMEEDLEAPPNSLTGEPTDPTASSPNHQVSARSSMALGRTVDLDVLFRWVSEIETSGVFIPGVARPNEAIPSYAAVDVRLAWRPLEGLELSILGRNLNQSGHREFNPSFVTTKYAEVPRSVFGQLTWSF